MPKKRKLNSKNPKYWDKSKIKEPVVKERRPINTKKGIYAVFLENTK